MKLPDIEPVPRYFRPPTVFRPTQLMGGLVASLTIVLAAGCDSKTRPLAPLETGDRGMVVSADPLASEAGVEMLRKGGNAIDAAVATTFAISVVEPFSAGIGGGGFLLAGFPDPVREDYRIEALDFRERAPKAASRDMYLDENGEVIERASLDGHLAAGVPGTVAGLFTAHKYYGNLPWETVVAPAIRLAETGFPVGESFVRSLERRRDVIEGNPAAKAIFTRDGQMYKPGEILIQTDLADTLKTIAADPQSFYTGEIAKAIAADMAENGGLITLADLEAYTPIWRNPLCGTFRQVEICAMPPPSSGGVHLLQILNLIEPYDLKNWGRQHPDTLHLLAESMRIAYADRAEYLGDPDFVEVPVRSLVSEGYADTRRSQIHLERTTPSDEVEPAARDTLNRHIWESPETSHLTVVDGDRNVVSLTFTVNGGFGAGVVAAGTGILLNNEMDDFSVAPGVPNLYGLVGGEANAIAPRKTPLSSMTPVIVTENNQLVMAAGSPGGSTIITTVLQTVLNVLEFDMTVAEAVSEPRIHHQWLPDRLLVDSTTPPAAVEALRRRGHKIIERDGWGNVNAIEVTPNGLEGAADPRRDGAAVGF